MSDEAFKAARGSSDQTSAPNARPGKLGAVYCEIDATPAAVELNDLNPGGLFVQSNKPPAEDSEVEVFLRLGELRLQIGGHVVQAVSRERAIGEGRRPGFGLLFTQMDEGQRAQLRRAIEAAHAALQELANPPQADPEERAVLEELRAELRALPKQAHEILGLTEGCDLDTARAAFFAASKRYHPHRFSRYRTPEIKSVVTELFIAHKRAYSQLEKTLKLQPRSPAHTPTRTPTRTPAPAASPSKAPVVTALVSAANTPSAPAPSAAPPGANPVLRSMPAPMAVPAQSLRPRAADTSASTPPPGSRTAEVEQLVNGGVRHLAQSRFDEAEDLLRRAAELDPNTSNARIWLLITQARRAKASGDLMPAVEKYFEVLALDPKHHEALHETKKYAKDAQGKPGLLGRLFGSGNK